MNAEQKLWSERSQKSLSDEASLQEQVVNFRKRTQQLKAEIAGLREGKARALTMMERGSPVGETLLNDVLPAIESKERLLGACNERGAATEEKIELFLAEEKAGLPERRRQQEAVAQLAQEIVIKDSRIEQAIIALRKLLEERREVSAAIGSGCSHLGFVEYADWQRLQPVLDTLPQSVLTESRVWAAAFLGETQGLSSFTVIAGPLKLRETLAHPGIYFFGETVHLVDGEAQPYLQSDPPAIMTADDFHALEAESRERNCSTRILITIRNADRKAQRAAAGRAPVIGQSVAPKIIAT